MHSHPTPDEVLDCPLCQREAATWAGDVDLPAIWTRVAAQVCSPRPGRLELLARRLLRSPGLARALVTTRSLLLSWVVASTAVLAVGAVASGPAGTLLVPLLAPALAAAGIAHAYGPGTDPAYELASTMPVSARMVLLTRALAVFALNAALGLVALLCSTAPAWITLSWLVPMTAVAALALAAATLAGSANVGVAIGLAGWCIAVLAGQAATGRLDAMVSAGVLTAPYVLFTALCVGVVWYAMRVPAGRKRGWS
jgi:hypothetical protein